MDVDFKYAIRFDTLIIFFRISDVEYVLAHPMINKLMLIRYTLDVCILRPPDCISTAHLVNNKSQLAHVSLVVFK